MFILFAIRAQCHTSRIIFHDISCVFELRSLRIVITISSRYSLSLSMGCRLETAVKSIEKKIYLYCRRFSNRLALYCNVSPDILQMCVWLNEMCDSFRLWINHCAVCRGLNEIYDLWTCSPFEWLLVWFLAVFSTFFLLPNRITSIIENITKKGYININFIVCYLSITTNEENGSRCSSSKQLFNG